MHSAVCQGFKDEEDIGRAASTESCHGIHEALFHGNDAPDGFEYRAGDETVFFLTSLPHANAVMPSRTRAGVLGIARMMRVPGTPG